MSGLRLSWCVTEALLSIRSALDAAEASLDEDERGQWELGNEIRQARDTLDWLASFLANYPTPLDKVAPHTVA